MKRLRQKVPACPLKEACWTLQKDAYKNLKAKTLLELLFYFYLLFIYIYLL